MRTRARIAAIVASAWLVVGALGQTGSLGDDVSRLVGAKKLGDTRVGVSLRDVDTGAVLADYHAGETFIPASNMKLLTSGAALLVLSPSFQFRTEICLDGDRLVVKGSGDPALADPEVLNQMKPRMTVGDVVGLLASAVSKAGVTHVRELIIDDRVFDRQFVHPSWPAENLHRGYSAGVGGVNFHSNVIEVFPRPSQGGSGSPPAFSTQPEAAWLRIENKARTVNDGKNSVWLTRDSETGRFVLRGEVRYAQQVGVEVTVLNPPEFFGGVLAEQLTKAGVRVGSDAPPGSLPAGVRLVGPTESFDSSRVLAAVSTPMEEVLQRCNTDSANLYAESLLKRMGHAVTREPGSWSNGASVLRMILTQKLGAGLSSGVVVADGSGLSRENAVSPAAFTRWLEVLAKDDAVRDLFTESLATPGEGTLRSRFGGEKLKNKLYAKSGYINGVRTLSGYVVNPDTGHRVAFSVMLNNVKDRQSEDAKKLHEEVVRLADRWLASRAREEAKVGG